MADDVMRFRALEGARAIAAFWVVLGHLLLLSRFPASDLYWPISVVAQPKLAVYLFMILSGFVISHLIVVANENYLFYIFRRWLRLFPLLAASVAFVVLFFFLAPKVSPFRYNVESLMPYIVAHLTMMHGVVPNEILPNAPVLLIGTAWSISTEWQFYLIAPIIVYLFQKRKYVTISFIAIFSYILWTPQYNLFGYVLTFPRGSLLLNVLPYFLIGVASYFCIGTLRNISMSVGALLCFTVFTFVFTRSYPIAMWAYLCLGLATSPQAVSWLSHPWLLWLGDRSYSIYLNHIIVLMMVRSFFVNPYFEPGTLGFLVALATLTIPLTIAASAATYRWIERPAILLGKSMKPKKASVHVSSVAAE